MLYFVLRLYLLCFVFLLCLFLQALYFYYVSIFNMFFINFQHKRILLLLIFWSLLYFAFADFLELYVTFISKFSLEKWNSWVSITRFLLQLK